MSQQSKQPPLLNGIETASATKPSRVRFAPPPPDETNVMYKTVHVNILLESSSYNIIGFVIIKQRDQDSLSLFNIRTCIKSQFDQDQLQILGNDTFKFLRNSIPISTKQETLMHVSDIALSDKKDIQRIQQKIAEIPTFYEDKGFAIIMDNEPEESLNHDILDPAKPRLSRASSAPHSIHNSSSNIHILPPSLATQPMMSNPSYETLPHHYQYIGPGAMPPPAHLLPSTPETPHHTQYNKKQTSPSEEHMKTYNYSVTNLRHRHTMPAGRLVPHGIEADLSMFQLSPRAVSHIVQTSTEIPLYDDPSNSTLSTEDSTKASDITYYSVLVRRPMLERRNSMNEMEYLTTNDTPKQVSWSIFDKSPRPDDDIHELDDIHTRKSRILFRKKLASALEAAPEYVAGDNETPMDDDDYGLHIIDPVAMEEEEPVPQGVITLDTPRAPDDKTALETIFGGPLPKIRPNGNINRMGRNPSDDRITNILANAVVDEETIHQKGYRQSNSLGTTDATNVSALTADKSVLFSKDPHRKSSDEGKDEGVSIRYNTTQMRYYSKTNIVHKSRTSLMKSPLPRIDSNEEQKEENIFDDEGLYAKINTTATNMQSIARQKRLQEYANTKKEEHHRNESNETLLSLDNIDDKGAGQHSASAFFDPEVLKSNEAFDADDVLIAKSPMYVPCRFTVVGSPLLTACEQQSNNIRIDKTTQRTWKFYDPLELILGLQGVHHSEDNPVWMDLVCDPETFVMISEHVRPGIHSLTIEDCVTIDCREKLEHFDEYLFCCIRTTSVCQENNTDKLCIIVMTGMIITYHTGEACENVIAEARFRLEKRHKIKCPSPGWVCHTLIDVIMDRMIPEVECRVQEVQNVENLVFALSGVSQDELLQRLQIARNWLMVYKSRLWPKSTMTHNLLNTEWRAFLSDVQQQYWNDINDHVARMVDLLSLGQSTLESAQNIFVAKISLEMADQSNELSDSAGRLTAVGSIFLPLSFFAGLWGMNCKVPFQYEGPDTDGYFTDDYYGFCLVFILMIVSAIVTYKYAMKFI